MSFIIRLENLLFSSRIGVFDFEREEDNDFMVDVSFKIGSECFRSECLESTVSYAEVYEVIEHHMAQEWLLLESVSSSIASAIKGRWPHTEDVSVKVTKIYPPIPGIRGSCSVEYKE